MAFLTSVVLLVHIAVMVQDPANKFSIVISIFLLLIMRCIAGVILIPSTRERNCQLLVRQILLSLQRMEIFNTKVNTECFALNLFY